MQLKGLIKVFTIIFILVSIYQLSFTVATKIVENKAESFASKGLTLDPPSSLSGQSKSSTKILLTASLKERKDTSWIQFKTKLPTTSFG